MATPKKPSLVRSVLPPLLFLLLCGAVGPIFLIIGLNMRGEPDAGWLLPIGIGITALDVVIGLLIGRSRYRSAQKDFRLRSHGRPGRAEVLTFDATNVRINDQPLMKVSLRIAGEGVAPFDVESRMVIADHRLPLLYSGSLPVLVDPETHEWEVDWAAAPHVAPGVPPTPVGAADTRSSAERLAELDDLLKRDLVSREEYDATRARILGTL